MLTLLKPVTWFAAMWAFLCGAISSGVPLADAPWLLAGGVLLAGPLVCAMSQAANDWCDRHVDAINEPHRPIPSGRVPGRWGLWIALIWTGLSLAMGALLGPVVFAATLVAVALAWAYSAPPFRLKEAGWLGAAACALCYEGLAWFTGAAALLGGLPDGRILALAGLTSLGAVGIMILNDFKSIAGDRQTGVRSVPAQLGMHRAARAACALMAAPQLAVIGLLALWGRPIYAAIYGALLIGQIALMRHFLLNRSALEAEPLRNAAKYNATGTTLFVAGMMIAAFAVRGAGA